MEVRLTAARRLVAAAALLVLLITQLAEARLSLEGVTTLALPIHVVAPRWQLQSSTPRYQWVIIKFPSHNHLACRTTAPLAGGSPQGGCSFMQNRCPRDLISLQRRMRARSAA